MSVSLAGGGLAGGTDLKERKVLCSVLFRLIL